MTWSTIPWRPPIMFWTTVGQASRQTADAIGPSTMDRSNVFAGARADGWMGDSTAVLGLPFHVHPFPELPRPVGLRLDADERPAGVGEAAIAHPVAVLVRIGGLEHAVAVGLPAIDAPVAVGVFFDAG